MHNWKLKNSFIFIFILLSEIAVVGAGLPLLEVWKFPESVILAPEKQKSLTWPAIEKKEGYILCLTFKAYLYTPKPSGWNPYIAVMLNGIQLDKLTREGHKRLFCRDDMFTSTHPGAKRRAWWRYSGGKPSIMTFMGPGTGEIDQRITSTRQEGYNYFLDISDAANYLEIGADDRVEKNKPNILMLSNTLPKQYAMNMHYDNIRIGYVKMDIANKARKVILTKFREGTAAATLKAEGFSLQVMKSGGMLLENNGDKYWFESAFSYPGTQKLQYSMLNMTKAPGPSTWKPELKRKGNTIEISAVNKNITLSRTITLLGQHISVKDKLSNYTNKPAGISIRHILGVKTMPATGSFRLSGMENDFQDDCAENPTCFVCRENGAVGIVAEDNVFRQQLELSKHNNSFMFSCKNLGIAGKKSYTLEWTIYPLKSKKYFSLVNAVRRSWGVNYTINGPICLFDRDIIDQKIRKTNITLVPKNIWFEYYNGADLNRDTFAKLFDAALKRVRKISPTTKVIPRLETNLITLDIRKLADGKIIPVRTSKIRTQGRYGLNLNKEQTAVLDRTKYADSLIRNADGNVLIDTYYVKYPYINLMVHPAENNFRYRKMLEQLDYALNTLKSDGVYCDQFVPTKRFCGIDYSKWDGNSVILDKRGNISQKFYSYAIAGSKARADIIKKVLAKQKIIMTNGQPVTRETQALPILRFQEMENDKFNPADFIDKKPPIFRWQTKCQLACPMILGQRIGYKAWYGAENVGRNFIKSIITALRHGLLYCYYNQFPKDDVAYGPVNHMFPFTPVELDEGCLIGKERIITCVSGKYIWPYPGKPDCFYFDCKGFDKPADFKMVKKEKQWEVEIKLNDWNEIAVIEQHKAKDQ